MTASNPHDLKIGDTLFIPPMGRGGGRTVIINKVGTHYAHTTHGRIVLQTLQIEWAMYGEYASRSEEAYLARRALERAHNVLKMRLDYTPRSGVTLDAVMQAAALLGVDIKDWLP